MSEGSGRFFLRFAFASDPLRFRPPPPRNPSQSDVVVCVGYS